MSVRLLELIQPYTQDMLKKISSTATVSVKDWEKIQDFGKVFQEKVDYIKSIESKFQEDIKAKNPQVLKEWMEFLAQEVVLPLLPECIKSKVDELTNEQWLLLDKLIFGKAQKEDKVVEEAVSQV